VTRVPGRGRRPTLADVAALAGVSVALVSIVMRDVPGASVESRGRVLQAADELGYRPDARARLLRSSRSRLLGVVFGVQHAFHGDLVSGLYTAADQAGYSAMTQQPPTEGNPGSGAAARELRSRAGPAEMRANYGAARDLRRCARHAARGDPNPRADRGARTIFGAARGLRSRPRVTEPRAIYAAARE
jgi:hypothetical protein